MTNETISLTIPCDYIDAAMQCVSKEETRYYLKGVFIDGRGYIVGTNGHMAFAANYPGATVFHGVTGCTYDKDALAGVIVPHDAITQASKGKDSYYTVERDVNGLFWLSKGNVKVHFTPVDGNFPAWDRIIPELPETETPAHYQPHLIAALGKIAMALGDGKKGNANRYRIAQAGNGPAPVLFPNSDGSGARVDVCAVIMPMRATDTDGWTRDRFMKG
jgi:hypothetical protein